MDPFMEANRARWDELVDVHVESTFYDVASFREGRSTLKSIELAELGDVEGRTMLHLQCHFGMDTLSWARRGARVTGVDFSERAVVRARALAEEQRLSARFIQSNIYDLPAVLDDQFDIVFTSYGVLCWLPDLTRWAAVIAHFLKPGGTFYIVDGHPFAGMLSADADPNVLTVTPFYFPRAEPDGYEADGSYAAATPNLKNRLSYEWPHSLSEIVCALIVAGLEIEFLHEFPVCAWARFPALMEQGDDGWWRMKDARAIPLIFSVKAHK